MAKGDIVLITFPFTDLSGTKLRPAFVLIDSPEDLTVCFITTQTQWQENNDLLINPTSTNGLRKISLIRINKIATLDKTLAKGLLGKLDLLETASLNNSLKLAQQLKLIRHIPLTALQQWVLQNSSSTLYISQLQNSTCHNKSQL